MSPVCSTYILKVDWLGRSCVEHSDIIDPAYIDSWHDACLILSEARYELFGDSVRVQVAWDQAREGLQAIFDDEVSANQAVHPQPVFVECKVEVPQHAEKPTKTPAQQGLYYLEVFLHDVFLAMNLSSPGSCDFRLSSLSESGHKLNGTLGLNSYWFEDAWVSSLDRGWPLIRHLPLRQVVTWQQSLHIGACQLARSPIERAIFSVLNLCRREPLDLDCLVWLAHALEALYDTRAALVLEHLSRRIKQLLDPPLDRDKQIRKQIREFYERRSSFVHGSMAIPHPLQNDILAPNVLDHLEEVMVSINFGFELVLATLQKYVTENWTRVCFRETYEGSSGDSTYDCV